MRLFLLSILVIGCSRSPEAELLHLLKHNYANLEVNESHKRKVITRLESFFSKESLNQNTEDEVISLLNEMSDGHIKLEHSSWPKVIFESGLTFDLTTEEIIVCPTCRPAIKKGLNPLEMIDGINLEDWLKTNSYNVAASTTHARRFRLLEALQYSAKPFAKSITVNGKNHDLAWVIKERYPPCVDGERVSPRVFKINLRNFWCTEGKELSRKEMVRNFKLRWDNTIAKIKVDDQLILDLRDNSGGGDEEVMHVLQSFFNESVEVFHYQYLAETQPGIWKKFFQTFPVKRWDTAKIDHLRVSEESNHLSNKVEVLIGPGCFSSCEIVAGVLKHEKRAILKGSTTHGGVGEPRKFPLGQGYSLMIPICRLWQKNGDLYEGVGVRIE
jgi:hypothetical protein